MSRTRLTLAAAAGYALGCVQSADAVARALAGDAGAHVGPVAAVVGHCWPAPARFDGGKGVATSFGQCLATFPAYAPLDVAVAFGTHRLARGRTPALVAAAASSAAWVVAGTIWWRRGLPNLWGPRPTRALPLANAATVAILAARSTQLLLRDRATPA